MRLKTLGIEGSTNLELIKAVTLKMKDADLEAALAKTELQGKALKEILSSHGVAEANLDETAQKILNTRATEANAKATTKMATAQGSLKSAIIGVGNAIKAHPYIAAAVGVAAAAALIVTAVATFTKNTDELIEENNNLKASMEETKTKISDSKTQIEEINTEAADKASDAVATLLFLAVLFYGYDTAEMDHVADKIKHAAKEDNDLVRTYFRAECVYK